MKLDDRPIRENGRYVQNGRSFETKWTVPGITSGRSRSGSFNLLDRPVLTLRLSSLMLDHTL